MTIARSWGAHARRLGLYPASLLISASLAACEPPEGFGVTRCSTRPTSLFHQKTSCTFTVSPLDSNGYTVAHESADFGSRSVYTAAVDIEGSLRVKRGSVAIEMVDDRGSTQRFRATADSPATFRVKVATTMRSSARGVRLTLMPDGVSRSADSVALTFAYVK